MIRPRQDLDAIDRELDRLGTPRQDIAELVARYAGATGADALLDGLNAGHAAAGDGARAVSDPPAPSSLPAPQAAGMHAASDASAPPSDVSELGDADEDHEEFELLVDDDEIERVEDDLFETA